MMTKDRKYALIKSMDDKACVRPGTLVGLRDVKRGGIYEPTDSDKARKLPVFRADRPDLYEVSDSGSSFSIPFRRFCTRVRDKVKNFLLKTTQKDVMAVSEDANCSFQSCEKKRVDHSSEYHG